MENTGNVLTRILRTPKRLFCVILTFIFLNSSTIFSQDSHSDFLPQSNAKIDSLRQYNFGFNLRVWMNNALIMGKAAFKDGNPPPTCGSTGIGCEYPVGSCIEHLKGAGPWIGGIINGTRYVTKAYTGANGFGDLSPDPPDTALRNIGPKWTCGTNGLVGGGSSSSDNDIFLSATDTLDNTFSRTHRSMGIKIIQISHAWHGKFADAILPMEYYFINIGKKTISDVYIGIYADMDVGALNVSGYQNENYAAYSPSIYTAYVNSSYFKGNTPLEFL